MPTKGVHKPCGRLELVQELGTELSICSHAVSAAVVGKSLYIKLTTKDLVVRVTPSTNGYADHYSQVTLELLSPHGKVDGVSVVFSDVLKRAPDDRGDYTGQLYIWNDRGEEDWYIARPVSLEPLVATIYDYVLTFSRT